MENKYVGYLLFSISILVTIVIFMFNSALKEVINTFCGMPEHVSVCPIVNKAVNQQTYIALSIVGLLVIVALVLIFSKPQKEIIFKTRTVEKKDQKKKINFSDLNSEEKHVLALIQKNKAIFQADLIEKTGFGKAKMTRIIDRLEGRDIVERKRRGMTNIVVLKE
ncbi:MarR family transcriptional regulator [Candidatus Woesearchaeota archaeon]|nr:MarR family transcriptional regulator [Candidatus Woesearchaeota archaeon]